MQFTPELIAFNRTPADKMAAITQVAALLVEAGHVEDGFRYGMIASEAGSNSYLGHGIAVSHGVAQTERHILNNSMALMRTTHNIPWGPDAEPVNLVIAVAAPEDTYRCILSHIANLTQSEQALDCLKNSDDREALIALLTQPDSEQSAPEEKDAEYKDADEKTAPPSPASDKEAEQRYQQGMVYPHAGGLHLLPATRLSEQAKALDAALRIQASDGRIADATNVGELVALGILHGQAIIISGNSKSAVDALIEHISNNSVTPEEALPPQTPSAVGKLPWYLAAAIVLLMVVFYLASR